VYVNPTQVYVNPTQVYVNPTQVYVNPTQVYVNPTQVQAAAGMGGRRGEEERERKGPVFVPMVMSVEDEHAAADPFVEKELRKTLSTKWYRRPRYVVPASLPSAHVFPAQLENEELACELRSPFAFLL
jgi:hypothetical protein